jgi:flagellar biosynthesis protein FlhA
MKPDKWELRNIFIAWLAIMFISPIPAFILNILVSVNIFLALAIFLTVVFARYQRLKKGNEEKIIFGKTDVFYFLPTVFLLCSIFGATVYVNLTWADKIILFFSGLIGAGGTAGIITGVVSIITICGTVAFTTKKMAIRITEVAALALDVIPETMTAIEYAYTYGEISEETFIARKNNIAQQANFLDTMDGAGKFIAQNLECSIIFMALAVLAGIIIRTIEQTIQEAVETSIAFGISGVIIFLLPHLVLSVSMSILSSRVYEFSIRQWQHGGVGHKIYIVL